MNGGLPPRGGWGTCRIFDTDGRQGASGTKLLPWSPDGIRHNHRLRDRLSNLPQPSLYGRVHVSGKVSKQKVSVGPDMAEE